MNAGKLTDMASVPFITAENARELQQKAAKARALARANRVLADARVEIAVQGAEFTEKALARVRLQLDQVYEAFRKERDPQKLDRLAAAQSRLAEQERQLSNRPLPGTLRPQSPGKRSKLATPEPIQPNEIPPP